MKRIYLALLAMAALALCSCSSTPPETATAKTSPSATPTATIIASTAEMEKKIIDLEKKSWEPVKNQSPEEAKRFEAPGYRAIYFGAIKSVEESANDSKDIVLKSISFSDWKVTFPVKDTAIVTYKYDAVSTYKGKTTGGPTVATATWVNIGGEWKLAVYAEARAAQEPKK